jgi:hypothetical protein
MLDPSYFELHPLYIGFCFSHQCASGPMIWNHPFFIAGCSLVCLELFFYHPSIATSYKNAVPSSNIFSLLHLNDLLWKS